MEKKLYPLKFVSIASRRPWGGSALVNKLGKHFVECDEEGNETVLGEDVLIGESWELSGVKGDESVVANGPLAGKTITELAEEYKAVLLGELIVKIIQLGLLGSNEGFREVLCLIFNQLTNTIPDGD